MTMLRGLVAFGALALLLVSAGCAKRSEAPSQAVPKPAPAVGAMTPARTGAPTPAPAGSSVPNAAATPVQSGTNPATARPFGIVLGPVTPQPPQQETPAQLQGTDNLLPLSNESPVYPLDYDIGPLASPAGPDTPEGAVYAAIAAFFGELASGKVDDKLLSPEWSDTIERLLSYPKEQGTLPTGVRIGTITLSGDQASAAIRMLSDTGRADGTVYLDQIKEKWYISDIQADFSQLAKKSVRTEEYEPTSWQWLLRK